MAKKLHSSMEEATKWYILLSSEDATQKDYSDWQQWKQQDIANQEAWSKIESITNSFKKIDPQIGIHTLYNHIKNNQRNDRRHFLKSLTSIVGVGVLSYATYKNLTTGAFYSDYSTGVGESKRIYLTDGTLVHLNTSTTINVLFDKHLRLIEFVQGEALIVTGNENNALHRPFVVKNKHGTAEALGTKFSVRALSERTLVSVYEGAVKLEAKKNHNQRVTLAAGVSGSVSPESTMLLGQANETDYSWISGLIVANNQKLVDFLAELSRYQLGQIKCDSTIENYMISGVFSTIDIDSTLKILASTFNIRVDRFMNYWVTLKKL